MSLFLQWLKVESFCNNFIIHDKISLFTEHWSLFMFRCYRRPLLIFVTHLAVIHFNRSREHKKIDRHTHIYLSKSPKRLIWCWTSSTQIHSCTYFRWLFIPPYLSSGQKRDEKTAYSLRLLPYFLKMFSGFLLYFPRGAIFQRCTFLEGSFPGAVFRVTNSRESISTWKRIFS